MIVRSNFFQYGELGERIAGIRDSEIHKNSANEILNMTITEVNTLRVAKQYRPMNITVEKIIKVIDTKYNFYIVVTLSQIITFSRDNQVIASLIHGLSVNENTNVNIFDNQIFISNSFFAFNDWGYIGTSNFKSTMVPPMKNKKNTKIDIYKVSNNNGTLACVFMQTYENPILINIGNEAVLYDSNIALKRIYKLYKANVFISDIENPYDGLIFGVMQTWYNVPNESYVIGRTTAAFYHEVYDNLYKGTYYTNLTGGTSGELNYGQLLDINNIVDVSLIQNRLAIATRDTIYFSKQFDYNNFRNATGDTDAFYIVPSPINNNQANIKKLGSNNGLFAFTDKGIYGIGLQASLTPFASTSIVKIVSDVPCSYETQIINNSIYYISLEGELYCVQIEYSGGQPVFKNSLVEKFDYEKRTKYISFTNIDGRISLLATTDENKVFIYDTLELGVFRRVSLELPGNEKKFGLGIDIIGNKTYYIKTYQNYKNARLKLNIPYLYTEKGGSYLNDEKSIVKPLVINTLNEDREAIEEIKINDNKMNNIYKESDDKYGLYRSTKEYKISDGITIDIETKENNRVLELRGIEMFINVVPDN